MLFFQSRNVLGHSQYHLAVAGGCAALFDRSLRRTHPLPRGGSDCVQVGKAYSVLFCFVKNLIEMMPQVDQVVANEIFERGRFILVHELERDHIKCVWRARFG